VALCGVLHGFGDFRTTSLLNRTVTGTSRIRNSDVLSYL
jgi:hypothetical protein